MNPSWRTIRDPPSFFAQKTNLRSLNTPENREGTVDISIKQGSAKSPLYLNKRGVLNHRWNKTGGVLIIGESYFTVTPGQNLPFWQKTANFDQKFKIWPTYRVEISNSPQQIRDFQGTTSRNTIMKWFLCHFSKSYKGSTLWKPLSLKNTKSRCATPKC